MIIILEDKNGNQLATISNPEIIKRIGSKLVINFEEKLFVFYMMRAFTALYTEINTENKYNLTRREIDAT